MSTLFCWKTVFSKPYFFFLFIQFSMDPSDRTIPDYWLSRQCFLFSYFSSAFVSNFFPVLSPSNFLPFFQFSIHSYPVGLALTFALSLPFIFPLRFSSFTSTLVQLHCCIPESCHYPRHVPTLFQMSFCNFILLSLSLSLSLSSFTTNFTNVFSFSFLLSLV